MNTPTIKYHYDIILTLITKFIEMNEYFCYTLVEDIRESYLDVFAERSRPKAAGGHNQIAV